MAPERTTTFSVQQVARPRMPETVRAFLAEQLAGQRDVGQIPERHVGYYREPAERADRPLRGAGHSEWLERLHVEAGNLAASPPSFSTDLP